MSALVAAELDNFEFGFGCHMVDCKIGRKCCVADRIQRVAGRNLGGRIVSTPLAAVVGNIDFHTEVGHTAPARYIHRIADKVAQAGTTELRVGKCSPMVGNYGMGAFGYSD